MSQGSGPSRAKARHLYHSGNVASSSQALMHAPLPSFACRSHRCGGECGGCRPACGFDAYNSGSTAVVSYLDVSLTGCCSAHTTSLSFFCALALTSQAEYVLRLCLLLVQSSRPAPVWLMLRVP